MNITVIYPNKRKTKSVTFGIAHLVIDKLLCGDELYEFYLPQDMPHVCVGCYACFGGHPEKCGGYEYIKKIIEAMEKSELVIFCSPSYVYHTPGQIKTLLDHFGYRWIVHSPDLSFMNKQALVVTSAAGGGMKSTVKDIKDSMNYWGVGKTHNITQGVWGYDWNNMPDHFMKKIHKKVDRTVNKIQSLRGNVTPSIKVKAIFYIYRLFHKGRKMAEVDDNYWYKKGYVSGKPWKNKQ